MFSNKKSYNKGMIAGIKSFQGRIDRLSNSIEAHYKDVDEKLDRFDKVNDLIIDELKRLQIKDTFGLIESDNYSEIVTKDLSMLLCTYMLLSLEENCNIYQYEYFKGCCKKLENYATIDGIEKEEILVILGENCDKTQAEISIKMLALFHAIEDPSTCDLFLSNECLDEFMISNKKIRDIKKYIDAMQEIYGSKLCFLYGRVEEDLFNEMILETEIVSASDMYEHGIQLIENMSIGGLRWIIKAAEMNFDPALNYIKQNYLGQSKALGYKNRKVFYISETQMANTGRIIIYCLDGSGNSHIIYENGRIGEDLKLVDDPVENDQYIAFSLYSSNSSFAYIFSINTINNECLEIDSWIVKNSQFPYIKKHHNKIAYGVWELDVFRIKSNETINDYYIGFDGNNKEVLYR